MVNPNSAVENNFRFPGQYFDAETGLHYNYHRYYDPRTGRYVTTDPIGLERGVNLYVYGSANPVNVIDPLGLYGKDVHYYATLNYATWAGFSHAQANEIASANQSIDDQPETNPYASVEARRDWHFADQKRVDSLLEKAFETGKRVYLGEALHALQDSYSHKGFGPYMGHIWTTDPDDYTLEDYRNKTQEMFQVTFELILKFYLKWGRTCLH